MINADKLNHLIRKNLKNTTLMLNLYIEIICLKDS